MTIAVAPAAAEVHAPPDHRGSWMPNGRMIATRILELRKRRGLMIALLVVNIGLPTIFLVVRLLAHAIAPKSYGPAGGYDIFTGTVAGLMYVFGFIVAATLGATAGSSDLTDGMFRHLVATGRSRLALYLARIPAGLAIVVPIVAVGFAIVCTVCVYAAPTAINYNGVTLPAGLSESAFVHWAEDHVGQVVCDFPGQPPAGVTPQAIPCGPNGLITGRQPNGQVVTTPSQAELRSLAASFARQDYTDYTTVFLYPSNWLMVRTGLWLELEALIGLVVGLGLASLIGQRTVTVVLMIVLEVILTPLLSHAVIPHLINLQRSLIGVAMGHLEPSALPVPFSPTNGHIVAHNIIPEPRLAAALVVVGWIVVWTILGAWRMTRRDA